MANHLCRRRSARAGRNLSIVDKPMKNFGVDTPPWYGHECVQRIFLVPSGMAMRNMSFFGPNLPAGSIDDAKSAKQHGISYRVGG